MKFCALLNIGCILLYIKLSFKLKIGKVSLGLYI